MADALATGKVVYARDQAGLTHAAIPLLLGNQRLGALIAGQCFSEYPQPLALQRVARHFGASPQELWNTAVHQVPVSHATLRLYADLLEALGRAFLRQRYAAILDRQLHQANERYRLMIEGSKDHALFTVDRSGPCNQLESRRGASSGLHGTRNRGQRLREVFHSRRCSKGSSGARNSTGPNRAAGSKKKAGRFDATERVFYRKPCGRGWAKETPLEYGFLLRDVTEARKAADSCHCRRRNWKASACSRAVSLTISITC